MKIAVINIQEHLLRCLDIPLVKEIPLVTLLKYACEFMSYLNLCENAGVAISHFRNYLVVEFTHPNSTVTGVLTSYAGSENPEEKVANFVDLITPVVVLVTNRLHSVLYHTTETPDHYDWCMIKFVGYNPISGSLTVEIN